jgi:YihY family inner membrane protein
MADGDGNSIEGAVRAVDRFQQTHRPAAFAFGVIKKFGDDRGGQLAALIAFYGFLSFFPLMLIVITVTAFLAHGNPRLAEQIRNSALSQFPVVGPDLASGDKALPGSGLGLAVGLIGLLWGALGVTQAIQYAFQEVWHVPLKNRPGFLTRLLRGLGLFALLGVGVVATALLASLGGLVGQSLIAGIGGVTVAGVVSVALALAVSRLLSPREVSWIDLLPGAVVAGVGWQVLETVGVHLVQKQLRHASQLYGTVGVVLGLISFLSLGAQLLVYATEINSVRVAHLWPRSVVQPPLTGPDRDMLRTMAIQEERRPEERVTVHFDKQAPDRRRG